MSEPTNHPETSPAASPEETPSAVEPADSRTKKTQLVTSVEVEQDNLPQTEAETAAASPEVELVPADACAVPVSEAAVPYKDADQVAAGEPAVTLPPAAAQAAAADTKAAADETVPTPEAGDEQPPAVAESEIPSTAELPAAPASPPAAVDRTALLIALAERRAQMLASLFGEVRPRESALAGLLADYLQAMTASQDVQDLFLPEVERLTAQVNERQEAARQCEQVQLEELATQARQQVDIYNKFFTELDLVLCALDGEMQRLQEDTEPFQRAPEELRSALLNHKQGLVIIHRMVKRLKDRKKEFTPPEMPAVPECSAPPPLPALPSLEEYLAALVRSYHDHHDACVRVRQEAAANSDQCKKEMLRAVKSFVEAVDGIDGGLRNEPEVRSRLQTFEAEYGSLIDFWFAAYHNLQQQANKFFAVTGIDSLDVKPGTPFDPATMEPVGTVANPDLNNEDVALVLRRGYMIHGEQVRPMMVEVVINK